MATGRCNAPSLGRSMIGLLSLLTLMTVMTSLVQAQSARIVSRPLSPQEIKDFGLTNTTQKAAGHDVIALGTPAYLEVQVSPTNLVVTDIVFSLTSRPSGSGATLLASPLSAAVPLYHDLDEATYIVGDRKVLTPDKVGVYKLSVTVEGTTNGVPVSLSSNTRIIGSTYRGVDVCAVCHSGDAFELADNFGAWLGTGHATAFQQAINGVSTDHFQERCISCHSVGYDKTIGAVNDGFDDFAALENWTFPTTFSTNNWNDMLANFPDTASRANIQCENCHGPADEHVQIFGGYKQAEHKITVSMSVGNCAQCHDSMTHHYKTAEWNESPHSHAYFRNSRSCLPCHSSHGFVDSVDGDGKATPGVGNEGISCAACHDPHSAEGPHQLRPVPSVTLGNGAVVAAGGKGLLCMKCHKGRRDTATYVADELGSPSSHFGPHHGPQADMLAGANAYTYGKDIPLSDHLSKVEDSCVHCHMTETKGTSFTNILHKAGGHTFKMAADGVDFTMSCVECHGEIESFDIGGHDYNRDGVVEGVQTEIKHLLHQLAMLLPPVGVAELDEGMLSTETNAAAVSQLMAVYNYLLVEEDGSHGVHNPKFAAGILLASLEDLGVTNTPPEVTAGGVTIVARPLTPQEITDLGLPGTTQVSAGSMTVGLGAPAYLEALVPKTVPGSSPSVPLTVTQVDWTLEGSPDGSSSALLDSPLDLSVPPYHQRDGESMNVVGRKLLLPDTVGTYTIAAMAQTTNNITLAGTNKVTGATYVGVSGCGVCHEGTVHKWSDTAHASMLIENISYGAPYYGEQCISCHTVGYDKTAGAENGGFDDVAAAIGWTFPATKDPTNWTGMASELQNKSNIQCENCHGPASQHRTGTDPSMITVSLSSGNCGQCHDAMTHHYKNNEWNQSLHAKAYYRSSCTPCHTPGGFIDAVDGDGKETAEMGNEGISCAVCHDPHADEGPHQLRPVPAVTLLDKVTTITSGGTGLACMHCHKSRRDAATYVTQYSSRFGPHHGPQADMLAGANAVEYGLPIGRSRHMQAVSNTCVTCHMQEVIDTFPNRGPIYEAALHHVGGHTFNLVWDGGTESNATDDVHLVGTCVECHGQVSDFDFGGEDWDDDGTVEGVQSEIKGLLHDVALLLPPKGSEEVIVARGYTSRELKAAFNFLFVEEDGSLGVHNPKYASGLLRASLKDLRDGVDSDKDGIPDDWEMEKFGALTIANGTSDYDEDGLSDELERIMGTDPKKKDTDGDGINDLAELQAGSDPLDPNSTPDVAISKIYMAVELAFMPESGVTYQVQAVSSMSTGIWINVDEPIVGSGEEIQKFFSIRKNKHEFYRVVELP